VLADHSLRPYEPSPEHILRRMIIPLCEDVRLIIERGTRNDSWDLLQGVSKECGRILRGSCTSLKEDPLFRIKPVKTGVETDSSNLDTLLYGGARVKRQRATRASTFDKRFRDAGSQVIP